MLQGDFGYSFEYQLPVSEVVGDRMWLTILVSFVTILFTWVHRLSYRHVFSHTSI